MLTESPAVNVALSAYVTKETVEEHWQYWLPRLIIHHRLYVNCIGNRQFQTVHSFN
jgi:hypothetical protein